MPWRCAQELELAWERNRELNATLAEAEASMTAQLQDAQAQSDAARVDAEAEYVERLETRVAAAVSVVQQKVGSVALWCQHVVAAACLFARSPRLHQRLRHRRLRALR